MYCRDEWTPRCKERFKTAINFFFLFTWKRANYLRRFLFHLNREMIYVRWNDGDDWSIGVQGFPYLWRFVIKSNGTGDIIYVLYKFACPGEMCTDTVLRIPWAIWIHSKWLKCMSVRRVYSKKNNIFNINKHHACHISSHVISNTYDVRLQLFIFKVEIN